jgi:hypothetical protein
MVGLEFSEAAHLMGIELAELDRVQKVWVGLLNGLWVGVLGSNGGICG